MGSGSALRQIPGTQVRRRPAVVQVVVLLPPPAHHAVRRGDHDVVHTLAARDPLRQGKQLVGLLFVLINTVVDILYAVVDPRLRARSA